MNYYKPNKIITLMDRNTLDIFLVHLSENKIVTSKKDLKFVYEYFNLLDFEFFERYEANNLDFAIAYVRTVKILK